MKEIFSVSREKPKTTPVDAESQDVEDVTSSGRRGYLYPRPGGALGLRSVCRAHPVLSARRSQAAAVPATAGRLLRSRPLLSIAAMVQPEQTSRLATSVAMLVCLASSVGGQEPVPLTARAQSLVDEITTLEARVVEWEQRATAAENEAARMRKENEALR